MSRPPTRSRPYVFGQSTPRGTAGKSPPQRRGRDFYDSQTGIPYDCSYGARCVQRLDDSQIHANRITFRISLRSSSLQEPRDPLLKVVIFSVNTYSQTYTRLYGPGMHQMAHTPARAGRTLAGPTRPPQRAYMYSLSCTSRFVNDPSAGSPTETLLRLLLPLNDQV